MARNSAAATRALAVRGSVGAATRAAPPPEGTCRSVLAVGVEALGPAVVGIWGTAQAAKGQAMAGTLGIGVAISSSAYAVFVAGVVGNRSGTAT